MTAGPGDRVPLALAGRRIVITRAADQAGPLAERLRRLGAEPVVVPLIEIVAPSDQGVALAAVLQRLAEFDWLVVTSSNGAALVRDRIAARSDGGVHRPLVAAVGVATAGALGDAGADLTPAMQTAAGLVAVFPDGPGRVLVAQAEDAEPTLAEGLSAKAWTVEIAAAYRTVPVTPTAQARTDVVGADAVLFASGSAVRAWASAFGQDTPALVVAIGPTTARVAAEMGLKVHVTATDNSLDGLVEAVVGSLRTH